MLDFGTPSHASSNHAADHVPYALAADADAGEPTGHASAGPREHQVTEITQTMIAEYLSLEPLHHRFEELKKLFKAARAAGVPVQAGPHGVQLDIRYQAHLTAAHIISRLGLSDAEVKKLRATAEARPLRYLRVW